MKYSEAKQILIHFNAWRRDHNIPNAYEMPNPTTIGIAIDVAVCGLSVLIDLLEHHDAVKSSHPHKTYKKNRQHLCRGSRVHFGGEK